MIALPVCRWRLQPVGADRHVCSSIRVRCNAAGIADELCLTCRHVDHPPLNVPPRQCVHEGGLLRVAPVKLAGRSDDASILARIHACRVHGECTPNVPHAVLACCQTCPDHKDDWTRPAAGSVRHMTYHLYPAGPLWRWNVAQLLERISLFNGRRLVTVATDAASATADEVAELFAGRGCRMAYVPNNGAAKESVSHMPMVEELAGYRSPADATWYGHGKGSGSHTYGPGVKLWAKEMYAATLDYWPAVRRELENHAAVGVYLRLVTPHPGASMPWHYSGSFRWLRNQDLYRRNWRKCSTDWYGSEMYPGGLFARHEASCLYGEFAYGGVGLYLEATWQEWAQKAADDWYAAHAAERWQAMMATIILTAHAQPRLVHDAINSVRAQTSDSWQLVVMYSGRIDAAGLVERYGSDARIRLEPTGEDERGSPDRCGQGWAINEAVRRGLVVGDLVLHLSDDDVLDRGAVEGFLRAAAANPGQKAWYGKAHRVRIHPDGRDERLSPLEHVGPGTPAHSLRRHVDGLQVCCRRSAWVPWPEIADQADQADGYWSELLAESATIHPLHLVVGTHRHTPLSTFTV